jgi:hypothetical protein
VQGGGGTDFTPSFLIFPWQLFNHCSIFIRPLPGMDNGPVRGLVTRIKNGIVNWSITIESKEKAETALAAVFTDWQVAGLPALKTLRHSFSTFLPWRNL